jgi:hypothetical protein
VAVATFSVHASWLSDSEVDDDAVSKVSQSFRPDDEGLCAWVDEREPRRFLVSFDVESATHATAARDCLSVVLQVPQIEPRMGTLEEVGATDEEGYLVVKAGDFEELRSLTD